MARCARRQSRLCARFRAQVSWGLRCRRRSSHGHRFPIHAGAARSRPPDPSHHRAQRPRAERAARHRGRKGYPPRDGRRKDRHRRVLRALQHQRRARANRDRRRGRRADAADALLPVLLGLLQRARHPPRGASRGPVPRGPRARSLPLHHRRLRCQRDQLPHRPAVSRGSRRPRAQEGVVASLVLSRHHPSRRECHHPAGLSRFLRARAELSADLDALLLPLRVQAGAPGLRVPVLGRRRAGDQAGRGRDRLRGNRRARAGNRWNPGASPGVLRPAAGDLRPPRGAADPGRGDHRLRTHWTLVRDGAMGYSPRPGLLRQGDHQRLPPAGGCRASARGLRDDPGPVAQGPPVHGRAHLQQPPELLCGRPGEHRHHRARGAGGQQPGGRGLPAGEPAPGAGRPSVSSRRSAASACSPPWSAPPPERKIRSAEARWSSRPPSRPAAGRRA